VPSPTYTLVEHYALDALTVVHLDLYRLADQEEIENLGVRDTLAGRVWLLVEWPERAPALAARCDLTLVFDIDGASARRVAVQGHTDAGRVALAALSDPDSSKPI
jgi:tRNA threonylcarbamoyladenosine biosynthesis protein TsaE